ncbi:putative manganese transporter [Paratractidigestivibacter sp.]|uniref:putative manganese transporter n=1 Tax=Paratractidigestivibacter sp. TaxID=2847316 RepID=UPI003AB56D77
MDLLVDVLADSVIDTLKLIPFLLVTYLAMEALEHFASNKVKEAVEHAGAAGPVVGALLGALPQCGFSAMAATLFSGRVVTAGTLVAVILSTSDEMIPVFLAHQEPASRMLSIIAIKVVLGIAAGLLLDLVLRLLHRAGDGHTHIHELCEREHCHCEEADELEELDDNHHDHGDHHGHHEHGHHHDYGHSHHGAWGIVRSACVHTAQVTAFIFLISLLFGLIIEGLGVNSIRSTLAYHPVRATFIAALVGLIPNCGASVAIAELFLDGTLATGPMLAGLLSSGGVGLLVLWRTNADARQNVYVTLLVYVVAVLAGLAACALGILL